MRCIKCAAVAILVHTGCSVPTGNDTTTVLAQIDVNEGEGPEFSVPTTVTADEQFVVTFNTYHGGCEDVGPTMVDINGLHADITPYTEVQHSETTDPVTRCGEVLAVRRREVNVRFQAAGSAVVVLHGEQRRYPLSVDTIEVSAELVVRSR